jgi:cephalosporin-C deacetylase
MSNHTNRGTRFSPRFREIRRAISAALLIAACYGGAAGAQKLTAVADHADTIYQPGQTVKWTVRWEGPGAPASVDYVVKKGALKEIDKGTLALTGGSAVLESKLDAPGTLLLDVKAKPEEGRQQRALAGVVAAPGKIEPSAARPADFDAFWASKLKELATVDVGAQLQPADSGKSGVSYWKITMNNIRGSHIRGQVARPAGSDKRPALLIVQWAGVYPLQKSWVTDRAAEGWLALNIEAHDLPIDEPESFYREQSSGPLKNYPAIGNEDRDTSYFLRMYLSCWRAADYLAHRKDWDGKTLVVMGGSQGGLQALMTAGFYPKITAALAEVPAGCDMLGPDAGRSPGWPMWYWQTEGKDPRKVREASRYYDVVNFASRIRCPVLIGAGMIDEVCPAAGILAAANKIRSRKEVVLLPHAQHQDENHSHEPYGHRCWSVWMPALRQGKPVPFDGPVFVAKSGAHS